MQNENLLKFARFDLIGGGHAYLRVGDIDGIIDPTEGKPYDATAQQETILSCGAHRYRTQHHVSAVISTIDMVLSGKSNPEAAPTIPPIPK